MANIYNGTTAPTITVEFDLNALGPAEPGASIWTPVSNGDVRAISIRRGKSVENQAVQPGVLTLTLSNQSGDYDPDKLASPWTITSYATTISAFSPRLGVRVKATWSGINYVLYQGYMETLDLDYGLNPTATLTFVDGLSYLAAVQLPTQETSVGLNDAIWQRADRVCNELIEGVQVWPTGLRNFRGGVGYLLYGTKYGDSVLDEIQTAADCFPARVHVTNTGVLTVCQWDYGTNRGLILSDSNAAGVIGYDSIEVDPGAKYLVNSVTVTKVDGNGTNRGVVTVEDTASMLRYGTSAKTYELPVQEAKPAATFYANQYSSPADRVKSVSFSALNFASQFPKLLATELADFCQVIRHTMDGRTLSFNCQVEGIEYDLSPEDWRVRFITSVVASIPAPSPGPEPSNNGDPIPPSPPTGLTGTTTAYIDFRDPKAQVSLTWTAPTTNADGTPLTDLRWYEVQYKLSSSATWLFGGISYSASYIQSGLTVNTGYDFRVFAVDSANNRSAASNTFTITSANVTTFVGATPSTPVVSSRLGTITIVWDGKNNGGGAMPSDFWFLEVHVSTTSGFTPTSATYKAQMLGASTVVLSNLTYSTTYYVKFVAYSKTSVASTPSAQASSSIVPLVDTDIINNTISGAKIANGTITASDKVIANTITGALIQALAIDAGKIAANAITADKIDAGAVTASKISATAIDGKVITGATVQTSASGARVYLDSSGLYVYNGSSNVVALTGASQSMGGFTISTIGLSSGSSTLYSTTTGGLSLSAAGGVSANYFSTSGTVTAANVTTTSGTNVFGGTESSFANAVKVNGITSATGAYNLVQDVNGYIRQGAAIVSSQRYKHDITPLDDVPGLEPEALLNIPVRAFVYNENILPPTHDRYGMMLPGLIAEEVDAVYPVAADYSPDTHEVDAVEYRYLIPGMLALIQKQHAQIEALEARVAALEGQ